MEGLELAAASGAKHVTFGVEASTFHARHNLKGMRVKMLERSFNGITESFKLQQKSGFRKKLGAHEDPVYICYPKHGLGAGGLKSESSRPPIASSLVMSRVQWGNIPNAL